MGKLGESKHLKALAAPPFWPVKRKEHPWTVKPRAGPHSKASSLPLLLVVRDVLGYAKTAREARRLIAEGNFKVDGVVRRDYKFPVGFMDVLEVKGSGEVFRVLPYPTTFFKLHPINPAEAGVKPLRIENKTTVKGGHVQLNLYGGRNVLIRVKDPRNPVEDIYDTWGTVLLSLSDSAVLSYVPFGEGKIAIVMGGRAVGRVGRIKSVAPGWRKESTVVTLEDAKRNLFQTSLNYIFVIGDEKPLISLPAGAWK
ncbi:MAG: 30S ribosomal protein S4e [Acidilobaceae archaeon]|nr:30S ribosomal protein S4e [Acidilobaceae archaeon]